MKHGEDGTHYACSKQVETFGILAPCCGCTLHKCQEPNIKKTGIVKISVDMGHPHKPDATAIALIEKDIEPSKYLKYSINYGCSNCGQRGSIQIIKGMSVGSCACPNCGCKTITRKPNLDENYRF